MGRRLIARLGAALVAPNRAVRVAGADRGARASGDALVVALLIFAASHLAQIAIAVRLGWAEGLGHGGSVLLTTLTSSVVADFIVIFSASAIIWLGVGRRRDYSRDFELACVAYLPFAFCKLVCGLAFQVFSWTPTSTTRAIVTTGGSLWAAAVVVVAIGYVRRCPRSES